MDAVAVRLGRARAIDNEGQLNQLPDEDELTGQPALTAAFGRVAARSAAAGWGHQLSRRHLDFQ